MEVKWLEDFLSLASTASFSRSAAERHVTQSAFSRRIRQLEDWVGLPLVDRASYPVRLTSAGENFRGTAQELLQDLYRARDKLREKQGLRANTLSFAALHTLSLTFFPQWLRRIEPRFGGLRTRVSADNNGIDSLVTSLREGGSDFLLIYSHSAVPVFIGDTDIIHMRLGDERVVPVSAPDASGRPLHRIEPGATPARHLAYGAGSFFHHVLADLFARRALERITIHENTMSEGLKAMALAGWGLAWIPESIVRLDLASGQLVRAADASWDLTVDIRLYRSLSNSRPVVEQFWRTVSEDEQDAISAKPQLVRC
ncbi:LysR substrate-binding domain-containing protein [Bosea sp. 2RAB26]|uniref:LysR substrate-binding domain-containing protein n=1 Tax=Bosea sp. 2RAB26 TaxID=3237476 RepID=UPI003F8F3533